MNDQTLAYLQTSLDDSFTATKSFEPPRITASGNGSCGDGSPNTPPASYCATANEVSIDETRLQAIATPPGDGTLSTDASGIGDFAAFAEIASRYVLAVQSNDKLSISDTTGTDTAGTDTAGTDADRGTSSTGGAGVGADAGLRTACLTGAWAGIARHGTSDPNNKLRLGSDDLDKAVAELLSSNSLIASDNSGHVVPAGFTRITAFRTGFLQGAKTCTNQYP